MIIPSFYQNSTVSRRELAYKQKQVRSAICTPLKLFVRGSLFFIHGGAPIISSLDKIHYQGDLGFDDTVYLVDVFKNQCIEFIQRLDVKFSFKTGGSPGGLNDKPQGF